MNKKLGLIVAVIVFVAVLGVIFLKMPKSGKPADNPQPTQTESTVTSANNAQAVEGTIKSLVTSGKSIACTYSRQNDGTTINGKIYTASGKMRGDFKSINLTNNENTTSHAVINDTKNVYAWTDLVNVGLIIPISSVASVASKSAGIDLNQQVQFSCQDWNPDPSLFTVPSNITFR